MQSPSGEYPNGPDPHYASPFVDLEPEVQPVSLAAVGEAWSLISTNLGVWVPTTLLYMVCVAGFGLLALALQGAARSNPAVWRQAIAFSLLFRLVQLLVACLLRGGMVRMAINQLRGQTIQVSDLFGAADVLPSLVVATLITGLVTGFGLLFCVVPGIYFGVAMSLTIPFVVDQKLNAFGAIAESMTRMSGRLFVGFLVLFAATLATGLGLLACGVGLLLTTPIFPVTLAVMYRNLTRLDAGPNAAESSLGQIIPPIADPSV